MRQPCTWGASLLLLGTFGCGEVRDAEPSPFADSSPTSGDDNGDSTSLGDPTTSGVAPGDDDDDEDPSDTTGAVMDDESGTGTDSTGDSGNGSESTSGGDSEGSSDTGFDTSNDGVVMVEVSQQSAWPTGECNDVVVTNVSDMEVTWEVQIELAGEIDMAWNTNYEVVDLVGTFTGVDFNQTLQPDEQASFGFCVTF